MIPNTRMCAFAVLYDPNPTVVLICSSYVHLGSDLEDPTRWFILESYRLPPSLKRSVMLKIWFAREGG